MNVRLSPFAREDLVEIWLTVRWQNGESAADTVVDRLRRGIETVASHPESGRRRDELVSGLRSLAERPWILFYRIEPDAVEVVRVLHGRRDLPTLL